MSVHPSTPPAAFVLLAAGAALAVTALVLTLVEARTGVVALLLGLAIGLVVATSTMVSGAKRQWVARRGE